MKKTALLMAALVAGGAAAATWPDLSRPLPARGGGEKDAAVVIGLETYAFVGKVPGAADNARAWYAHLTKTVGIPPSRVALLLDADAALESMRRAAREAASQVKPGGTLWFVYIGHGAPSEDGKDGVLVGVDAQQSVESLYSRSLRQRELLGLLAAGKQEQTLVLLDACFSGRGSEGAYLAPGLQPLLPVAKTAYAAMKKAVVLTAGTSKQFAGPLPGANRPAFSYLMLGAMRGWGDANKDGAVTAAEAVEYAGDALKALLKGRQQTPEANPEKSGALVLAAVGKGKGEAGPDLADLALGLSAGGALPQGETAGSSEKRGPVAAGAGDVTVLAKPKEGTRLELTDPSGKALASGSSFRDAAAKVGTWKVVAKAAGYEDEAREFEVLADEPTLVKIELRSAGSPKPTVTPAVLACPPGMASVPGGSFVMGDRGDQVTVASYCMDLTEVTVAAYGACVSKGACTREDSRGTCNWTNPDREQHPVNCVTWNQSDAFCKAQGKRLPTEEEWEWAARGGPKGTMYPWGNEPPGAQACWNGEGNDVGDDNRKSTCPVGSHAAGDNPQGIHDLAGNVYEWTSSLSGAGRSLFGSGPERVRRSARWDSRTAASLRSARREGYDPSDQSYVLGFRCVTTP
jgi:formylglycine-generating enzyme required for sulfatase activity